MARLIDADAAEKYWSEVLNVPRYCDDYAKGFQTGLKAILKRPTIEAEPVRHGRWVHNVDYEEWAERYVCSECNRNAPTDGDYRQVLTDYCPKCGAKMDGEQE